MHDEFKSQFLPIKVIRLHSASFISRTYSLHHGSGWILSSEKTDGLKSQFHPIWQSCYTQPVHYRGLLTTPLAVVGYQAPKSRWVQITVPSHKVIRLYSASFITGAYSLHHGSGWVLSSEKSDGLKSQFPPINVYTQSLKSWSFCTTQSPLKDWV